MQGEERTVEGPGILRDSHESPDPAVLVLQYKACCREPRYQVTLLDLGKETAMAPSH